ncbi:MAG TPA: hypothetical protein PK629_08105 [Oscillospiraceae bacterium]|nr:hypothetical protein [Oscillospiraceae bacterium]HPF55799.1 hypothetical protein [Clostridiales bacterium]HPK35421.1 hypothetical protein [Oscillospiraceae bacterium]HPR75145.1 hypothetical protein [Oscillospiraceae bacterium]
MRVDLLPAEGNLYKANLHCHTKEIDSGYGFSTPQQIKELYKEHGYQIIAFTDNKLSYKDYLNDDEFMALPGFEVHWENRKTLKIYHFNCYPKYYGVKEEYFPLDLECNLVNANKLIKSYVDNDYLVMYNHPACSFHGASHYETKEFFGLQNIFAMEIYNHIVEKMNRTGWSDVYYDAMLRNGRKIWAVATDDNHSGNKDFDAPPDSPYSSYMGGFIMIKAKELNHSNIINALEKGNFYSCVGKNGIAPQIHNMYIEDHVFYADFSPVKSVYLKNPIWHCPRQLSFNDDITHFETKIDDSWTYVRLEITDSDGCKALGNPYYIT